MWLKLQDEKLQDLRQKAKISETTKRKWTKVAFLHKKQQEALDSLVKALTKKKENENVLIDLELINLKSVFLSQFEELRRKTTKVKKEKFMEDKEKYQRIL